MWLPAFIKIAQSQFADTCRPRSIRRVRGRRTSAGSASRRIALTTATIGTSGPFPGFHPDIVFLANRPYDAPGNELTMVVSGRAVVGRARSPVAREVITESGAEPRSSCNGAAVGS